jgi:hypothetical protein
MDDFLANLSSWAWARHHNPLSWYIRPLFLLPYVFFAWRRSPFGIAATLVALASSMAWFPAPTTPEPKIEAFLAAERAWLSGPWSVGKVGLALTVPLSMGLLAAAFWRRSWRLGVFILIAIAVGKTTWSVVAGGTAGWAVVRPALAGLLLCIAGVVAARRWSTRPGPRAQESE